MRVEPVRTQSVREQPTRLVLLGHPVGHSLSPLFQNAALQSAGLPVTYDALDVTRDALSGVLRELARGSVAGNVTIPHKEAVATLCATTTEIADRVGAVNTFWHEKGKLVGDNTDVAGALCAIRAILETSPMRTPQVATPAWQSDGLSVAVIGAGGAAAAVLVALQSFSSRTTSVFTRTPARAQSLGARLGVSLTVAPAVGDAVEHADLVINCTPIGLHDDSVPVPASLLKPGARVLDLISKRGETFWVRECRSAGHIAEDGLRMLIEQGAAAFERWFDIVPDRASMWRSIGERRELTGTRTPLPRS